MLSAITDWTFLNEPLWRWAIFLIAIGFILWAWGGILTAAREVI